MGSEFFPFPVIGFCLCFINISFHELFKLGDVTFESHFPGFLQGGFPIHSLLDRRGHHGESASALATGAMHKHWFGDIL